MINKLDKHFPVKSHCLIPVLPGDTSNLTQYLGKTYTQWTTEGIPVYLATVKENTLRSSSGTTHMDIEVGDESNWKGYRNGPLEASGKYQ